MKKVECPSCGGTGIIRGPTRPIWKGRVHETSLCHKCNGFGFVLKDQTQFSKLYPKSSKARFVGFGELQEFTGLVKVQNVANVIIPGRGTIPYNVFYKEYRNSK